MVSHHASLQSITDTFDLEHEQDYDFCYAELERQILELTAEDEEHVDRVLESRHDYRPSGALVRASKDSRQKANSPAGSNGASYPVMQEKNEKIRDMSSAASTWVLSARPPKSNGTGVFIPSIVKSRTRLTPENTSHYYGNKRRIYRQAEISENSKHLLTSWRLKKEIRLSN